MKNRKNAELYAVEPLFDDRSRSEWPESSQWVIEGELDNHLVVSIPVDSTPGTVERLYEVLGERFGRKITIVTANMEFLAVRKLTPSEAAKVLDRIKAHGKA